MSIIGFDVSKDELIGVRINKRGDVQETYTIANTTEAITVFLDAHNTATIGCEATAEYHNALALLCIARDIPCVVLNPIVTKQFTRATVRKRKTDLTDAHVIAKCVLQGEGQRVSNASFSIAKRMLRTSSELTRLAVSVSHMKKKFQLHWSEETRLATTLQVESRCWHETDNYCLNTTDHHMLFRWNLGIDSNTVLVETPNTMNC